MASSILLIMAIEDGLTFKVSNWLQLLFLLAVLSKGEVAMELIVVSFIILGLYIIYERKFELKIGGADIKIFCTLLLMGVMPTIYILFWSSFLGLVFSLVSKKKIIPYVPFLWLGYTIVNI